MALIFVTFLCVLQFYKRISKLHSLSVNCLLMLPRVFAFPRPWNLCLFSVSHLGCRSSCRILHLPRACFIRNFLCLENEYLEYITT